MGQKKYGLGRRSAEGKKTCRVGCADVSSILSDRRSARHADKG